MFNHMLPTSFLGQAMVALAIQTRGGTSMVIISPPASKGISVVSIA